MGDRSNIKVTFEDGQSVFFYTHWDGMRTMDVVREALTARERVTDSAYFARILFSRLVGENVNKTDGYGISTFMPDNNPGNPIVHVKYPHEHWGAVPAVTLEDEDGNIVGGWD